MPGRGGMVLNTGKRGTAGQVTEDSEANLPKLQEPA